MKWGNTMIIFAWKNVDAFRRHMEEMESFRLAHKHLASAKPAVPSSKALTPLLCPCQPVNGLTENGKKIVVPIWYISMPKGSQN
jgi:hypothetical protein